MSLRFPGSTLLIASLVFAAACDGPTGPMGEKGANGTSGANGTNGQNGQDGMDGEDGRNGRDVALDPSLSPVEKLFAGFGGKSALDAMTGYRLRIESRRWAEGEGFTFDARPVPSNTGSATISVDLAGDRLREDVTRTVVFFGAPVPQNYTVYVDADVGHLAGVESIFGAPTGDLLADGVAAVKKEHLFLNPQHLARRLSANPDLASDGGLAVLDGSVHHLVVFADPIHPITLWVNAQTGRLTKASTLENSHLLRDRTLEAFYFGWEASDGGVAFPKQVVIALGDEVLYQETRSAVEIDPTWPNGHFDLPAGAMPMSDAAAADRGARSSEFHQGFQGIGIRVDGLQTFIQATELAPGVWFLAGGSHNSMAIEQTNGVVIVEPPLYTERSQAILDWAQQQFPAKPVTHVAISHHHHDHSGGVRTFAAHGARVVVQSSAIPFYEQVFAAPSTIVPDPFSAAPVDVQFLGVPDNSTLTLSDPVRPVSLVHIDNSHANDMIFAYIPTAQLVFESDLYNPTLPVFPGSPFPGELYDSMIARGFDEGAVATIAGGHGGLESFSAFRTAAGR